MTFIVVERRAATTVVGDTNSRREGVLMPSRIKYDATLLKAAEARLDEADVLLQRPTPSNLARVRFKSNWAGSVLRDVDDQTSAHWRHLMDRAAQVMRAYASDCRLDSVRHELLSHLDPGPDADVRRDDILWVISGRELEAVGDVALRAFAPSARWPKEGFGKSGALTCMWGPHWILGELRRRNYLASRVHAGFVCTREEAETTATLWAPYDRDSAYQDAHQAHAAAVAV